MLRCIVVDDEAGAVEVLRGYIRRTPQLELVETFRGAVEALAYLARNEIDLAFLDIDMPDVNGLELAGLIDRRNTMVIFCTAYAEFAAASYERSAVDYLLKPVAFERFLRAVAKALQRRDEASVSAGRSGERRRDLFIKSGAKIRRLDPSDILFLEKNGHYIVFHTKSGEFLSRMSMQELFDGLPGDNFARIHKSFVVALDKIETIDRCCVSIGGRELPIGSVYRGAFLRRVRHSGN